MPTNQDIQNTNRRNFKAHLSHRIIALRDDLRRICSEIEDLEQDKPHTLDYHNRDFQKVVLAFRKKETKRTLTMWSYMHNGNREKYLEYKQKTMEAMSDFLTLIMESDATDHFVACETGEDFVLFTPLGREEVCLKKADMMKQIVKICEKAEKCWELFGLWK